MPTAQVETKFFTYDQNNSGGIFINNDSVSHYVIIEALNANHANDRAQQVGIYFNGCDDERDCPCCGDRWRAAWINEAGNSEPMIYGEPAREFKFAWGRHKGHHCIIYFMDGRKEYISRSV